MGNLTPLEEVEDIKRFIKSYKMTITGTDPKEHHIVLTIRDNSNGYAQKFFDTYEDWDKRIIVVDHYAQSYGDLHGSPVPTGRWDEPVPLRPADSWGSHELEVLEPSSFRTTTLPDNGYPRIVLEKIKDFVLKRAKTKLKDLEGDIARQHDLVAYRQRKKAESALRCEKTRNVANEIRGLEV